MKKCAMKILMILLTAVCLLGVFQSGNLKAEAAEDLSRKKINIVSPEPTGDGFNCTPSLVSFFDYKGYYNVVSCTDAVVYIYRYNKNMKLKTTLKIKGVMEQFGNIVCDDKGNYYICWAKLSDLKHENIKVMSVVKYNYNGKKLASRSFKGYDLYPWGAGFSEGTQIPFDAGTCEMAINNGILACNFAREMYNGHQSNMVFYIDCETMKRKSGYIPYCSHSFDQACIATSDGGFLMANQGDAYPRGFVVSKIGKDIKEGWNEILFHFREGCDYAYGYNETFAELGGIVETENTYAFGASSDRTLSLAPKKKVESMDLFVQILKKDFTDLEGKEIFYAEGATRKATGKKPQSANTELFLEGDEKDYGIIWLTDYKGKYYASNPKILSYENKIVVMWERRSMATDEIKNSYYTILNEDGTVYRKTKKIGNYTLPTDSDPVIKGGKIYWVTVTSGYVVENNVYTSVDYKHINILDIRSADEKQHSYETVTTKATLKKNGKIEKKCKDCGKVARTTVIYRPESISLSEKTFSCDGKAKKPVVTVKNSKGKKLDANTDYTVKYSSGRKEIGKYKVTVTFKGNYKGEKTLWFSIVPPKVEIFGYQRFSDDTDIVFLLPEEAPRYADVCVVEYSTSESFAKSETKKFTVEAKDADQIMIDNLKPGQEYYIRIRSCKVVGGKEYYSEYSFVEV